MADAFIEKALKRFRQVENQEQEIRQMARECFKFTFVDQWPTKERRRREDQNRPVTTINRTMQFVNQVANDQRQQRVEVVIAPKDDSADEKAATAFEGHVREIQYRSKAQTAYTTAGMHAAVGGFGYIRVLAKYCDQKSFRQELYIKTVIDPMAILLGPHEEMDGSDAEYGFVIENMPLEEYEREHGKWEGVEFPAGDDAGWYDLKGDNKFVRVAEYWYCEYKPSVLYEMADGAGVFEEDLPKLFDNGGAPEFALDENGNPRSRKEKRRIIKWKKITAEKVIEEGTWPGSCIPIVPVYGTSVIVEGRMYRIGLVQWLMDPARSLNYMRAAQIEEIALKPKPPYVGAEGQFEGHEAEWRDANVETRGYLEYKPVTLAGTLAPPPQRNVTEPATASINVAALTAEGDLKGASGLFNASLGQQGNETSGRAILARQKEGNTATFHLMDNLARSIEQVGRILVECTPFYYSAPYATRSADGEPKRVEDVDLSVGRYTVNVETGQTMEREQTFDFLTSIVQSAPQLLSMLGDLLMKASPLPGNLKKQMSERMKLMLPPEIKQAEQQDGQPDPNALMAELQKMQQEMQALQEFAQQQHELATSKQMELEQQERIEMERLKVEREKIQAQLSMKAAELDAKDGIQQLQTEIAVLQAENARADAYQQAEAQQEEAQEQTL